MVRRARILVIWVAITACLASVGCVKLRQVVTVMPDGSGKIEFRFGLSEKLVALAKESDEDPFKEVLPAMMQHKTRGVVAYTEPKREKKAGFSYLTYAMYFRDINKVRIGGLGEMKPTEYRYARDGESATLTVSHGTALAVLKDYEMTPDNERGDVREVMAGLEISDHFVLPGDVKPVDGLKTKSNRANLDLSLEDLLQGGGPVKHLKSKDKLSLTIPRVTIKEDAVKAFNNELKAAVDAWRAKQQTDK